MLLFYTILELIMVPGLLNRYKEDGLLFDFGTSHDFSNWIEVSDTVREGGKSKAIITSHRGSVNPLPNGACFAGMKYNGTRWNLSDYDGIEAELRRTGPNEWFKFVFDQEFSYEKQFRAPSDFGTVRFPFTEMKAYHWGKPVDNAPPLNKSNLDFGIQVYGGVFERFKQSGPGSLQINWVRAYKSYH
ncbi:unnamed protein product [Schistocephalus solidus]|uniref:CIA30 domain-containing protein n=1 Tax=Schistocephalus solidus TaxID=70667 RepID=A0A183S800_SCHSO|nr:unnamed protein product [Schistocephalus solidus]